MTSDSKIIFELFSSVSKKTVNIRRFYLLGKGDESRTNSSGFDNSRSFKGF